MGPFQDEGDGVPRSDGKETQAVGGFSPIFTLFLSPKGGVCCEQFQHPVLPPGDETRS